MAKVGRFSYRKELIASERDRNRGDTCQFDRQRHHRLALGQC